MITLAGGKVSLKMPRPSMDSIYGSKKPKVGVLVWSEFLGRNLGRMFVQLMKAASRTHGIHAADVNTYQTEWGGEAQCAPCQCILAQSSSRLPCRGAVIKLVVQELCKETGDYRIGVCAERGGVESDP